jgi:ABC-type hemin transport system substrate-binding protein
MPQRLEALLDSAPPYPRRVVCLTEETTEILYRIGEGDRVVGVSGFTVRPKEAVYLFNQRSIAEILQTVRVVAAVIASL